MADQEHTDNPTDTPTAARPERTAWILVIPAATVGMAGAAAISLNWSALFAALTAGCLGIALAKMFREYVDHLRASEQRALDQLEQAHQEQEDQTEEEDAGVPHLHLGFRLDAGVWCSHCEQRCAVDFVAMTPGDNDEPIDLARHRHCPRCGAVDVMEGKGMPT